MGVIKANTYIPISCEPFSLPFPLNFELYYSNTLLCAYSASSESEVSFVCNSNVEIPLLTPSDRKPKIEDIYYLFRLRSFPDNAPFTSIELFRLELEEYNPYEIIRRTHGLQPNDMYWIKFSDENINYKQAVDRMNDYYMLTPEQRHEKWAAQEATEYAPAEFSDFGEE